MPLSRWTTSWLILVTLVSCLVGLLPGVGATAGSLPPLLAPRLSSVTIAKAANANRKVALIVANGAYRGVQAGGWPALVNPVSDARLVADAFTADGFEVTTLLDGTHDAIARGVAHFESETAGAKASVIYYAGHGFEYAGRNYLVPVDAPSSVTVAELPNRFVDLDQIIADEGRANGLNLIFLDACRTPDPNIAPVPTVTIADGPAETAPHTSVDLDLPPQSDGPQSQVAIFYSTARGEPAFDGAPPNPGNSPFALNVAEMLKAPRIELSDFFNDVTYEVEQQTRGMEPIQQPYVYQSIHGQFYFRDTAVTPATPTPASQTIRSPHLTISDADLQTIDEPILAARVLRQHTPAQVQQMAEGGDPLATYLLGYFYEFGIGVPKNLDKARDWLERAAVSGHPEGELEYGYFLQQNPQAPGDSRLALLLLEQAAAQKDVKAETHLAVALLDGSLGKRDQPRAIALLRDAAGANDPGAVNRYPNAMFQLAAMSGQADVGDTLQPEIDRLTEVADSGNMDGYRYLCEIADRRGQADIYDCTFAARAGFASAQAHLAIYYHEGRSPNVPVDPYEARHWTKLALSQDRSQDPYFTPTLQSQLKGFQYRPHRR